MSEEQAVDDKPVSKVAEFAEVKEEEPKQEANGDLSTDADVSVNPEESINKSDAGNVGDNEASDDEDDSEEELPPGLLERPVEILKEKRVRKKIKRFNYDDVQTSPSSEKKKSAVTIPEGTGIRLAEHPRVEYQLQRNKAEDLKIIHKFFFGNFGDAHSCKKHLREFKGFVLEKDTPEYESKEEFIGKFTVDNLKWAMEVCDVPNRKGNKDDLIDSFMDWCMCPKPQEKPIPAKRKKKDPTKKKVRKTAVKREAKSMDNGDVDPSSDAASPSKKQRKKKQTDATKKKTPKKSSPKKTPTSTKKAKIKITPKRVTSDSEDTSDDEPLQRKKGPPSDNEIKKYVEMLLKDADLEVITMKSVFQQVYEQYPEHDLSDRKAFIKETVKKIIS